MEGDADVLERLSRLESVLDSARLGIWDWNPQTNAVVFNPMWKHMLGYAEDELPNELSSWERLIHPDDKAETYAVLTEHLEGRTDHYESQHRLQHKDGHYIWILDTGRVVKRDADGKPVRVTGIHQDITRTMELQASLRQERDRAEFATRAKTRFLASMSHEIRTPLNGIRAATDLLLIDAKPDVGSNFQGSQAEGCALSLMRVIQSSVLHMNDVVDDILDYSKVESGQMRLVPVPTDIGAIVQDVYNITKVVAQEKGVALRVGFVDGDANLLLVDPTRLRQIVLNLVQNALKFTDEGFVQMSVRCADGRLTIRVQDTGIGIAEAKVDKIFESFQQGDDSTTRKYGGTGLGLAICRCLAEAMGGTLTCQSRLGSGSTFCLNVPALAPPPSPPDDDDGATSEASSSDDNSLKMLIRRRYQNATVLFAEDNKINSLVGQMYLRRLGLSVIHVASADLLLEQVRSGVEHDLILTDWHMPGMTGLEAATRLRSQGYAKAIVCWTASVTADETRECMEAGCNTVIWKPFSAKELVECMNAFLPTEKHVVSSLMATSVRLK